MPFTDPIILNPATNAHQATAVLAYELYQGIQYFPAGIYTISCVSSTNTTVSFYAGVTLIGTATTVSGTVNLTLSADCDSVNFYTNTGSNIVVTFTLVGLPISPVNDLGVAPPLSPTIGVASYSGNLAASIAFTPSGTGAPATSYTVTSSPGGFTGTGASSPITVSGLAANTAYTFTAVATNSGGSSSPSAASNSITTGAGSIVSGGVLTSDSTYFYRTFLAGSTLGVAGVALVCDSITVAGGGAGAGGSSSGWGAGAGGLVAAVADTLAVGSYGVVIGAGGIGTNTTGTAGSSSSFNGHVATGGGAATGVAAGTSGGGTGNGATNVQASTNGSNTYSSWATATGTGQSGYYGGGGGCYLTNFNGGLGGGGTGPTAGSAANGLANTGGGGAGTTGVAGNGGSGIVIVRYLKTAS